MGKNVSEEETNILPWSNIASGTFVSSVPGCSIFTLAPKL